MNTRHKTTCIVFAGLILVSPSALAQRIEENDPSLKFNGAWTPTNDPNASGGSYTVSNAAGSTVTFNVTGNNFVLYRKLDPNGGNATVTVDGNNFGNITFYSVQTAWQIPAAIDELSNGQHTIVLTVSATQPQGSGGTYVYIDALQNPVPASLGPTQSQMDAITRTNFYRNLIGLPPARHHLALGLAANAHAQYLNDVDFVANGSSPHIETQGASKYFTAPQPQDRDAYFGYTGPFAGSEDSANTTDGITFVDGWMDGVDHRDLFMSYGQTQGGFGGYPLGATMDMGASMIPQASPVQTLVYTYPSSNESDVWLFYDGTDGPDSANLNYGSYGYPITLGLNLGSSEKLGNTAWVAPTGTLTAGGNTIPVNVSGPPQGQPGNYYMIPLQPLTASTPYTATMSGVDYANNPFTKTWQFTTSNLNAVHSVRPGNHAEANSFTYNVLWDMIGTTVPSQLEYGTTTSYGSVVPATLYGTDGPLNTYSAAMVGIVTVGGVVHYRATATDASGNKYTSPDHTLTLGSPIPASTIGFASAQPFDSGANVVWETAGTVASTQVKYGATSAYGTTTSGQMIPGGTSTQFGITLFNLTNGATYHYQITATDSKGVTYATPDATFTVGSSSGNTTPGASSVYGTYKLIPQNATNLCLDVFGGGTSPGTTMDAWNCNGGSNQSFNLVSQGNGIYVIRPLNATGLCLDVYGGGASTPGTSVDAWTCTGGNNQQWNLISDGGNIYELAPQNAPGLRLDVYGGGASSPGTQIDVWTANGGSNQKWALTQ